MEIKDKNKVKLALDILMALIFAILFDKNALGGITFHEVAGLAIGAFIIIHMVLNKEWLKVVTKKIFNKTLPARTRAAYIVDVLLLTAIAVIIITGILMSKVVFADILSVHLNVSGLHKAISYIALMLIGIHLGLSWNRVVAIVKKLLKLPKKRVLSAIAAAFAIAVFSLGSYNIVSTGYFSKVTTIASGYSERGEISGENVPAAFGQGNGNQQHNGSDSGKMNGGGGHGSENVLTIIYENLSIMAAFAVFAYYIDKLIHIKPKKRITEVTA
ncbi:MAG: DUF4405 domain-containing protein [Oscillospiraceae bacterium]